jgi:RNA polymerase sigma-70 factor (ECF subfamily)
VGSFRVQADIRHDDMRQGLIAMLPRLKRFADVLVGDRDEGKALLRRALIRMLSERHRYQKSTPLDRWAFSEIYRRWLNEHRDQTDALTQTKPTHASFERLFHKHSDDEFDALTANFLWRLPPPQRSALLLVYGEGLDHAAAGSVLDAPDHLTSIAEAMHIAFDESGRVAEEAKVGHPDSRPPEKRTELHSARNVEAAASQKALDRFWAGHFSVLRPGLIARDLPAPAADNFQRLQAAREQMAAGLPAYAPAHLAFHEADKKWLDNLLRKANQKVRVSIPVEFIQPPVATPAMEAHETAARQRLLLALALLHDPAAVPRLPDATELRAKRETSNPSTIPARSMLTSVTSF